MARSHRIIFASPNSFLRFVVRLARLTIGGYLTVAATAFAAYNAAFVIEISKPFLVVVTSRVDFHVDCFPFNDVPLSFCSEFLAQFFEGFLE